MLGLTVTGCNSIVKTNANSNAAVNPTQTYLAAGVGNLQSYVIDHTANYFVTSYYVPQSTTLTIQDSGSISKLSNGIFDLSITYYPEEDLSSPSTGNWDVELPGQAALTELEVTNGSGSNTSFAPLVPTQTCPNLPTAVSFLFVTIPNPLGSKSSVVAGVWNPKLETAYGSASIATDGSSVQFSNISQHTLPAANGGTPGTPLFPASASVVGACSTGFFGQTVSVPSAVTLTTAASGSSITPFATVGIGPAGFLLEDLASGLGSSSTSTTPYENVLGAGYGAIGLPEPTSALSTSSVVAAQYQGILYGAAGGASGSVGGPGFRLIGSFGFSNLAAACPALPAPNSSTVIYGGEFASNNPSANTFGNCDLAIDLGAQDASNNGLYPGATVYVSSGFPYNGSGSAYSFPAVAVAGQISGKYAIFLIGADTIGTPSQPWGIYLLQSN
jgi:hypothetical protein